MMAQTYLVKLRFKSPAHFGEVGIGVENYSNFVHSDTLFSGICHAWLEVYGRKSLEEELINKFNGSILPFQISSAFPFLGDKLYFPKPFKSAPASQDRDRLVNILKDTEFLEAQVFSKFIDDTKFFANDDIDELDKMVAQYESIYEDVFLPRIELDRIDARSRLYFCGAVRFKQNGGLFFLLRIDEEIKLKLQQVLQVLGERGLGGERNIGYGRFETDDDWPAINPIPEPKKCNAYCTLSLYYPSEGEKKFFDEKSLHSYELILRTGWIESSSIKSGIKKHVRRLFKEGSIFRFGEYPNNVKPVGKLVNVKPTGFPHGVYRYGLAFPVGVNLKLKE